MRCCSPRRMSRLAELLRRAKCTYQGEGPLTLARNAAAWAALWVFKYEDYYLFARDSGAYEWDSDVDFVPEVDGWSFRIIYTNEEADELEAEGFHFREYAYDARNRLDQGAIAFCVFVGHELANIGWLCPTQQARDSLNEPPARVDFPNGEACVGGGWTNPKYRRMGLHIYCGLKRDEWWLQSGIVKVKWVIARRNVASLTAQSKVGDVSYAEGRLVKILWWKHWREKPLPPAFETSDVVQ